MAKIVSYLQVMVQRRGSDLHLSAKSRPMLRAQGEMQVLGPQPLERDQIEQFLAEIVSEKQKEQLHVERSIDFALRVKGLGIFRFNVFYQQHGLAMAIRSIAEIPPSMEALGLPDLCRKACHYSNGLVLVTGPTGSGKSTTLASMIEYINQSQRSHIITLEDPIEYFYESKSSLVNQRQLGLHFNQFSGALKQALREDPDVVLVGEMRDLETIAMAVSAAETGHLVFATLHTNSAAKSVDRILDGFPAEQQLQIRGQLAESLRMVISQKLLPRADGRGRLAFHDILVVNSAVSNLIREGKTYQIPSVMQTGRGIGMQLLDTALIDAVNKGVVKGEDAWIAANDKAQFSRWAPKEMKGLSGGTIVQAIDNDGHKKYGT